MSEAYQTNTRVEWDWGDGIAEGNIREVFREEVTKTIKGTEVTRNGSNDNPAYVFEQLDGGKVLKLHSEIRKSTQRFYLYLFVSLFLWAAQVG